ncbi:MAG: HAMP domain-containing sensor histidine kinase [Limosilactobacillus sp.]|uniref:sensor histidine kinase n=1 Tax=Limosilactobacillus sp. TaxID=2773925 RepID=UPI0026F47E97|nr:HAMP domain-containing sensor histidine kinase [Limosilactobacillus sp.]
MKLIYRLMVSYLTIIAFLMIIISISFVNISNKMIYGGTWNRLEQDANALVNDSIRYDPSHHTFQGFDTPELNANARLLMNQNTHFTIYTAKKQAIFSSNGFIPKISKAQWKQLRQGKVIRIRKTSQYTPKKNSGKPRPRMTQIIKPYRSNEKLVAVVVVATFVQPIENNIHEIKMNLIITLIVAWFLTMLISYYFSRSITTRINRLGGLTKEVAKGNYDVHLDIIGKDEIGDLAQSFNHMTASLKSSQEEIHRQEERRRQFMANAAHEMRTPLTTINGILEGLQYDVIDEADRKHSYELMQNDTKRLIRLVNDNLNYEKIRTNQITMERKLFDASAVLSNLQEQLSKKAASQGDKIELETTAGLMVYADYDRFVQIMFNIIQNAIQFTQNGTIQVRAKQVENGTQFEVQDEGIGMTEEQLKNIWERYYKADKSRMSTKYGESGLGLAIVRQLVRLHNGKIDVKSEIGKGSTFTIFFPNAEVNSER